MWYIVICGLFGCNMFSMLSHTWHDIWGKNVIQYKIACFDFHYNFSPKHLSFSENSARYCHKCIQVILVAF